MKSRMKCSLWRFLSLSLDVILFKLLLHLCVCSCIYIHSYIHTHTNSFIIKHTHIYSYKGVALVLCMHHIHALTRSISPYARSVFFQTQPYPPASISTPFTSFGSSSALFASVVDADTGQFYIRLIHIIIFICIVVIVIVIITVSLRSSNEYEQGKRWRWSW